jgi:hypothetical protein
VAQEFVEFLSSEIDEDEAKFNLPASKEVFINVRHSEHQFCLHLRKLKI